jgi:DNA-binding transcriptional LysR family regulator
MRIKHLRQADLNLLVVFTALAEERNVTRAADRLLLSQPAVSRALQRLRAMFHDDLLIRTSNGYEPTPKGQRLLQELGLTLPRLDRLLSDSDFDPATEETTFRIAMTDHASQVLCPLFCKTVLSAGAKVSFDFVALHDGTFEAMEKGRLDLLLNADDGHLPSQFASEIIFEDEFACVVARENRFSRALTLKQYLAASHIGVSVLGGLHTIPEQRLAAVGGRRHYRICVPYWATAIRSVAGTKLIATVPRRIAELEAGNPALKILKPPEILGRFKYLMAWHPRMNTDAAHLWLRTTLREAGNSISLHSAVSP